MFSRATAKFVQEIDPEGSLIHVCRINDSRKLAPWALVVKRKPIWFWKKPKYHATDFSLKDLLLGGDGLTLEVSGGEFVKYSGTYGGDRSGKLETSFPEAGRAAVTLEGTSKLQSRFGQLRKEELNIQKLLVYTNERLVDMNHELVKQMEKSKVVLAVVKETIVTTDNSSVVQNKRNEFSLQGMLGLFAQLGNSAKMCVEQSVKLDWDSDVSLEIPTGTVIAYSILELKIKNDGHCQICLQQDGGFESNSTEPDLFQPSFTTVDGSSHDISDGATFNDWRDDKFSSLAKLPQPTRQSLFKDLLQTMRELEVLSSLQSVLEDIFLGATLDVDQQEELQGSQKHLLRRILEHLGVKLEPVGQSHQTSALLKTALLVVSAMEELPVETLGLLSESEPEFLEACDVMVCSFKERNKCSSLSNLPPLLQEIQSFQAAEKLFASANLKLRKDADSVRVDGGSSCGVELLVLRFTLHGLSSLHRE